MKFIILILWCSINLRNVVAYKPVVIVHGIMFNLTDRMQYLKTAIERSDSGTTNPVSVIELLWNQNSFLPMWNQVSRFRQEIKQIMDVGVGRQGINLIAYSQGGLIARGVIETTPNHTVENFISLSSPQNGFHGEFFVPNSSFPVGNEEKYSDSVSGFWKDPRDMIRYKREGRYLAALNNEVRHPLNLEFKRAMCKLKQLVLIGGPDDGVVVPWQSALFGFDDVNGRIVDMKNQPVYTSDSFCLKTLDNRGAITRYTVPGVRHPDWHNTDSVIRNYIIPHLV